MSSISDEARYRALFLEESQELLDGFLDCLFRLEAQPADLAPVDEIFRVAHTLKGMAGAMGFSAIAEFCHRAENLLDRWRHDKQPIDPIDLEFMFQVESVLRDMTANADDVSSHQGALAMFAGEPKVRPPQAPPQTGVLGGRTGVAEGESGVAVTLEDEVAYPRLRFKMVLNRLEKLGAAVRTVPGPEEWETLEPGGAVAFILDGIVEEGLLVQTAASVGEVALVIPLEAGPPLVRVTVDCGRAGAIQAEAAPSEAGPAGGEPPADARPSEEATPGIALPSADVDAAASVREKVGGALGGAVQSFQQTGIRVDRKKLDRITNMVGEILMLRRRLRAVVGATEDPELQEILELIERTSHDLEREVLSARMVPIGSVFQRFQRLVKELSVQLGKEVDAEFIGGETEIDRALLDRVQEPLVHIIRNSLDHGLETPEEREAAGKSRRGRLTVTAAAEHGNVALKVEDDGRGIDPARVLASARKKGVLSADSGVDLTQAQVFALLFQAGFSTAEKVTDVSGRGVGLDIVRKNVVEVGGDINMISTPGAGTKVILEFPPTLSLLQSLVVRAGHMVVGVPRNQVFRIIKIEPGEISWVRGMPMIIVNDQPVAIRSLVGLLERGDVLAVDGAHLALLVKLSSRTEALVVDSLIGDQELVIKPVARSLSRAPGLVGTCVIADGRLSLFVDLRLLLLQRGIGVEA
ncbi:MAG: chemotaxis protein CheA [Actinobacteria bacterium]|nr:chemotaxis protein CheA [Actinomycetota bacterium]